MSVIKGRRVPASLFQSCRSPPSFRQFTASLPSPRQQRTVGCSRGDAREQYLCRRSKRPCRIRLSRAGKRQASWARHRFPYPREAVHHICAVRRFETSGKVYSPRVPSHLWLPKPDISATPPPSAQRFDFVERLLIYGKFLFVYHRFFPASIYCTAWLCLEPPA